jgi:glycerate kinase
VRVVCAPDSFKESLTALEAARAMAAGVRRADPAAEVDIVPMADGGEGTVRAVADALGGALVTATVDDALGRPRPATYALAGDLAVIELAEAAGLAHLAAAERDTRRTSTGGVGQLIRHALDRGARRVLLGLGGSATTDAGAGLAHALGVRFLDADGRELPPGGAALARLARVDVTGLDPRVAATAFQVACDVTNPLLGPRGAAAVFGPQKGADATAVADLDAALTRWADVVEAAVGRSVRDVPGAGAAGGTGAGLLAFTPAVLARGVELVAAAVGLAGRIRGADWVFTGEGSIDAQTLSGKTPWGVAAVAHAEGVPSVWFGGRVTLDVTDVAGLGVRAVVPIVGADVALERALADGARNLSAAAERACRRLATIGRGI